MMRIFGVILAGGTGRRMGGADKSALLLGAQPLLARVIDRLAPQVERLAISANGDAARFAAYRLPVLPDALPQGPLSGVLAALDWAAPQGATAVVSVAVDTPFFPGDLVPQLLLAAEGAPFGAAVAESGGRAHPTFALWPVALREDLRAALARGEAKVMAFAQRHQAALARFSDDQAFLNINTAQDLAAAEALLCSDAR
jgi:molybdopterin-guanine dinucleotide biosynthesis protein A